MGKNVRWKAAIPGLGHSSPVVSKDRVFVTSAVTAEAAKLTLGDAGGIDLADDRAPHSWRLFCLSARDGKVLWEKEVTSGLPRAKRHVKASQANATPATDGRTVVALFGSEGLFAFDFDGRVLWRRDLGVLNPGLLDDATSEWGHASSPVIHGDKVIVQVDRHRDSYLAALDLATGKDVWRVARDERPVWSTPTLVTAGGRTDLVVIGGHYVRGYDPATGKEVWRFKDEAEVKTPTPFVSDGLLVLAGGYRGRPILALKTGAIGRRVRGRRREERAVPRLADGAGGAVHEHTRRLLWVALQRPRRGHLVGLRPRDRPAGLPGAHERHPCRLSSGQRRQGLRHRRGRRGHGREGGSGLRGARSKRHGRELHGDAGHRERHAVRPHPRPPLRDRRDEGRGFLGAVARSGGAADRA